MSKPQFAILRFAKYKGPEISNIEAHNERTKENYASNPDIDKSRSHLNFHLITPEQKYRAEAERQIKDAGCRTRSDSVRVVEALVTASPEFFKGKKKGEVKAYFQEALDFIQQHQDPKTIISAVVHMDEKTPHMHLSFVPLTEDGRLCAKEIVGNKKKLTQWQDRFWEHMVKKYPDLERGESASETGRDHIPPRVFKEMTRLTKQKAKLEELLSGVNAFNAKGKAAEIGAFLDKYIPAVEQMHTTLKKYNTAFTVTTAENKKLKKKTEQLEQSLDNATQESTLKSWLTPSCIGIMRMPSPCWIVFRRKCWRHIHTERRKRGRLPMVDEWSGFAALLANLIEKYAVVLDLDALPDLVIEESMPEKVEADDMIHENNIESAKAA